MLFNTCYLIRVRGNTLHAGNNGRRVPGKRNLLFGMFERRSKHLTIDFILDVKRVFVDAKGKYQMVQSIDRRQVEDIE